MNWLKQRAEVIITALVFFIVGGLVGHYLWKIAPPNPRGGTTFSGEFQTPVIEQPSTPVVPTGRATSDFRGTLTITVRDTVKPGDTVGTVKKHLITALIPKNDSPPVISPITVEAYYSKVSEPIAEFTPSLVVGGSAGTSGAVSPFAGVQFFRLFNIIELGAGLNKEGLGPFVGYEFFREFSVLGGYNIARWKPSKFFLGVAYRF